MSDVADDKPVTLRFSPETKKAVEELARKRGISFAEFIRRAISTEKYLLDETATGSIVLLRKPDGSYEKVEVS
jgi:predicted DNA-binding protein